MAHATPKSKAACFCAALWPGFTPPLTVKQQKCWFLFLPAYSPDLNPIEMAFSKLKAHLRRLEARTYDQLIQALGDICGLYDPDECWNFFKAAGCASCKML